MKSTLRHPVIFLSRILAALALLGMLAVGAFGQERAKASPGSLQATFSGQTLLSGTVKAQLLSAPPKAPWQLRRKVDGLDRDGDGMPDRNYVPPVPEGPIVQPAGGPPAPPVLVGPNQKEGVGARANTDSLTLGTLTSLNAAATSNSTSVVLEPTTASNGNVVMYAANWFAAISNNGGSTFSYINPYTLFPASDGGFCCDQVLQYIPSIDRFVWLLQYVKNGSSENRQRIATASTAQALAGTWNYVDITSQSLSLPNQWLDYPAMGVSAGNLYLTTNVFNSADSFTRSVCIRFTLPDVADAGGINFVGFSVNDTGSLHPAQAAGTRAFIAAHNNNSSLRVIHWDDGVANAVSHSVSVPNWSSGPYSSATPAGYNWLARVDSRITAATVVGNEVWFGWTAAAGGAYSLPQPYINIVRVDGTTFAYLGDDRLIQFGANAAAAYPSMHTNSNGEVGITYAYGGAGVANPNTAMGFLTGGDRRQFGMTGGTHGPSAQVWGDYLTIRPDGANPKLFSATGYALVGGTTDNFSVPIYVRFGRASDLAGTIQTDIYEADDTTGTAKTLASGQTQYRNIHAVANLDHATFTLAAPANINLATDGATGDTVMYLYGPNNPATLVTSDDDSGNGNFSLITRTLAPGTYWVKIEEFGNTDTLPAYSLALTAATISLQVTSPNGGESWATNSNQTITWNSANVAGNVNIEFSSNGGSNYASVVANTPNDGSHSWTVPNSPTTQGRIRVTAVDNSISDQSDANFSLVTSSITVSSPNGGESWTAGTNQNITWNSVGVSGNVLLEYSTNAGSSWTTIAASTTNDGTETWTVPNTPTSQARVRVTSVSAPSVLDQSNANFTILAPPSVITVTAPNGGQTLVGGASVNITWTSSNVTGNVQLQWSSDGGSTWSFIVDTANDGTESWTVPMVATTQGRVRVTALNGSAADASDANFTIVLPSITVNSPNGGESYPINTAQTITWSHVAVVGNVRLEYSLDGGATWVSINANTANDGTEPWTTPATPNTQARVRVSALNGSASDTSNGNFSVTYTGGILKTPARLNFGTVKRLKPKTVKAVIENKSKTQNLIVSFAISGAPFSLPAGTGPVTILPKKKITVFVLFTPPAIGDYVGTLIVNSSDPLFPAKAIPTMGKAR